MSGRDVSERDEGGRERELGERENWERERTGRERTELVEFLESAVTCCWLGEISNFARCCGCWCQH